jgi:hypothetical protein
MPHALSAGYSLYLTLVLLASLFPPTGLRSLGQVTSQDLGQVNSQGLGQVTSQGLGQVTTQGLRQVTSQGLGQVNLKAWDK